MHLRIDDSDGDADLLLKIQGGQRGPAVGGTGGAPSGGE